MHRKHLNPYSHRDSCALSCLTGWLVSGRARSTRRACTGRGGRETPRGRATSRPARRGSGTGRGATCRARRTVSYPRVTTTMLLLPNTTTIMFLLLPNTTTIMFLLLLPNTTTIMLLPLPHQSQPLLQLLPSQLQLLL